MDNVVSVSSFDKRFLGYEERLSEVSLCTLRFLGKKGLRLEIFLVGSSRMRGLANKYLNKDKSTNVIAVEAPDFPNAEGERGSLGEIYLCPPYIKEHGENMEFMLVHGILHLLGFNHEDKSDRMLMESTEDKVLEFIRQDC